MVSKARLDLPEPDSPVITTSAFRGNLRCRSLRLCSRAPETTISPVESTTDNECRAGIGSNLCSLSACCGVVAHALLSRCAGSARVTRLVPQWPGNGWWRTGARGLQDFHTRDHTPPRASDRGHDPPIRRAERGHA